MADAKTIVILGGGVGGVAAARALRKRLPRTHRVVLIDREPEHGFAPSLLWLMVGQRTADAISRPLARLARKGIEELNAKYGAAADPAPGTATGDIFFLFHRLRIIF